MYKWFVFFLFFFIHRREWGVKEVLVFWKRWGKLSQRKCCEKILSRWIERIRYSDISSEYSQVENKTWASFKEIKRDYFFFHCRIEKKSLCCALIQSWHSPEQFTRNHFFHMIRFSRYGNWRNAHFFFIAPFTK